MPSDRSVLRAEGVTFGYGRDDVVRGVTLELAAGTMSALAGPNGSGKTTVLRLLSGARAPRVGTVALDGTPLRSISQRLRARQIAVVNQHVDPGLAFSVERLVAMGRTPYVPVLGSLGRDDLAQVELALVSTETYGLRQRRYSELSGGERQRVAVAMALAQGTSFLLLDEPTVHLDLHHQHELLELLRDLRRQRGIGVLAVMHDLNLAALYFDHLAVLDRGVLVAAGGPSDLLRSADVMSHFRAPLATVTHPTAAVPQVLLSRRGETS